LLLREETCCEENSKMGQSASKEKFRESVTALIQVDVSADDAEFWDELWKIPSSAEEVFELLPAASARRLRDERFENLATLFTQAVAQLCQIVETPYNIYFDQALNCVRVLTRILPFVLEKGEFESLPSVARGTTKAFDRISRRS
jgi:High-temperature-induced dauer-formation protein